MTRKDYILGVIQSVVRDPPTADMLYERLNDEGLLNVGYGDNDIDRVIESFKEGFGVTRVSKFDRYASHRLVRAHGAQSVVGIVKLLASSQGDRYMPIVNNIQQLEEKWVSVLAYLRKSNRTGAETIDI